MMNNKKRTQKELRPMVKADVDKFVAEMLEKYPEILRSSLEDFMADEIKWACSEIYEEGRILTNKERWCC